MLIKLILIIVLGIVMIWFFSNSGSAAFRAWKKILFLLFIALAVFAVVNPDSLTRLAKAVGVGRGADLLLYILAIAFIVSMLSMYLRTQDLEIKLIKLARKQAIVSVAKGRGATTKADD